MKTFMIIVLLALIIQLIGAQKMDKIKDCKCKLPSTNRIVGGRDVRNNIPWAVSLAVDVSFRGLGIQHFCGGTIISHKWIMTAAHCIIQLLKPELLKKIRIRVGITELDDPKIKQNTYLVKRIVYDKRYNPNDPGTIADFAMIEVAGVIPFSKNVQPACVGLKKEKYNTLHAVGWGSIERTFQSPRKQKNGVIPNRLKEAFFNYDEDVLNTPKQKFTGCSNYLICLNPKKAGDSVCVGDSGGGLIVTEEKSKVVGIAQFVTGQRGIDDDFDVGTFFCNGPAAYSRLSWNAENFKKIVGDDYCTTD